MPSQGAGVRPPLVNNVLVCEIDPRQFQTHARRQSLTGDDEEDSLSSGSFEEFHNTLLDTRKRLRGKVTASVGPTEAVPPGIELFALPDGVSLCADNALRPRVHSFVLTSGEGERVYGFCYTHWRPVSPDQTAFVCSQLVAQAVKLAQTRPPSAGRRLPTEIFAPRVICVVTGFPFHNCFVEYVQYFCEHHHVHSKDHEALASLVRRLYDQLNNFRVELVPHGGSPDDAPMEMLVVPTDWGEFRFPGMFEANAAPPICDLDFPLLLRLLSVTSLVQVISAILSESSILFVSRHACNLTPAIEAILALIFPLKWPYAYVPLLPFPLRDYLQVPHPFLIGAAPELVACVPPHAFLVDLDANSVRRPENYKKPSLPASCQRRMAKAVLDFIETLSLPRYPVMSLTQWQYIRQEEQKSEATSKANLSTQVLLDSESAFDFDLINTEDVNECRSPPPETLPSKHEALANEEGSVNAKLVRAHMSFANLIGPRSDTALSEAGSSGGCSHDSSMGTTSCPENANEGTSISATSTSAVTPTTSAATNPNSATTADNFGPTSLMSNTTATLVEADLTPQEQSVAFHFTGDDSGSHTSSAASAPSPSPRASSSILRDNISSSSSLALHDASSSASFSSTFAAAPLSEPPGPTSQESQSTPDEEQQEPHSAVTSNDPNLTIQIPSSDSHKITEYQETQYREGEMVDELNSLSRPAVRRSLSVKIEDISSSSSLPKSLSSNKLHQQQSPLPHQPLPRSQTDMKLSRFKHSAVAPSILSRSRVTFTLRSRFMDVFCSMLKGYLLFVRHNESNIDKTKKGEINNCTKNSAEHVNCNNDFEVLFNSTAFLKVVSPVYRDYMSKFVKTHIFGTFIEERSRTMERDWFDLRIREVLTLTTLRSGLEARAELKGVFFIAEKCFLSTEWHLYQFSLQKMALSWTRAVARKNNAQTGVTKLGRVDLRDGMTQMTIPSMSGPSAFPLTLNVFCKGSALSSRLLESSHTFFFETEATRRRLIRFILARTTTASLNTLQMFLDYDRAPLTNSYLSSPVVHKPVTPSVSIERLTSSIMAATEEKSGDDEK